MAIARHETGTRADLRALASQVHPVFMLPPLAASWFGAAVAGEFGVTVGAIHIAPMFFAVYTAHVKDGYIDFYSPGQELLDSWEVYLLRNQSRGRGIGFLAAEEGTQRFSLTSSCGSSAKTISIFSFSSLTD